MLNMQNITMIKSINQGYREYECIKIDLWMGFECTYVKIEYGGKVKEILFKPFIREAAKKGIFLISVPYSKAYKRSVIVFFE